MSGTGRDPSVRRFAADEWQIYRDLRLRALADAPDAFARTHSEEADYPDERWEARLADGAGLASALALVGESAGKPVGLGWGRIDPSTPEEAHVYQMWVAQEARAHGIGRMLLEAIVEWASASNAHSLSLGVTCGDTPALRLYRAAGFEPVGEPEPLRPGSALLAQTMTLPLPRVSA